MIHAFGDESIGGGFACYALAIFEEDRVSTAEGLLAAAKRTVGVPEDATLHCRVIFKGDARRGTVWDRPAAELYSMLGKLCGDLQSVQRRPIVVAIDHRKMPAMPTAPDHPNRPMTDKGAAVMAYQAVASILIREAGQENVRIWADPDRTRIPWGLESRQIDSTRSFYVDFKPGEIATSFEPTQVAGGNKPRLLEIADLYAYVTGRVASGSGGSARQWFTETYAVIAPFVGNLAFNRDPQWKSKQGATTGG